jgi:hypothetical protein
MKQVNTTRAGVARAAGFAASVARPLRRTKAAHDGAVPYATGRAGKSLSPIDMSITAQTFAFYKQMWALWQAGKHISAGWIGYNQFPVANTTQPEWWG